jgi:eukaryotic-like serine/threonine-protein kinase
MMAETLCGLPFRPGDLLARKYRLERVIGEGGTGIVVAATHVKLEQRVAIKFLRQALVTEELRMRFEREARAMESLESEHVALVLDAGTLENGAPFMVLEHLPGRDLARVLREDGRLPLTTAVQCMLQVCSALAEAHKHGIVHRDLKPANLFLVDDDDVLVKVLDFGISKILDKKLFDNTADEQDVTHAFTVLGSPRYMAPEQVRDSKDVDYRADLWSVGAVLFQLITGEHAFAAASNLQASVAVLNAEPRRLADFVADAPSELEAVVRRCLTKNREERFASAEELADALHPFAGLDAPADPVSLSIPVAASSTTSLAEPLAVGGRRP